MAVQRVGGWRTAQRILRSGPRRVRAAADKAIAQELQLFRKELVEGITSGAPGGKRVEPPAQSTLATRRLRGFRGSKPLIQRGDLRRSIATVKRGFGEGFVGFLRTARSSDGARIVDVASTLEFGKTIVIRMTPAMRRFLAVLAKESGRPRSSGGGAGIIVVRIPPRPMLAPVFEKLSRGSARRVTQRIGRELAGDFGGL